LERKDEDAFGSPPEFTGGLFEPVLDNEDDYDITDGVMQDVLTVFIEGESRTVINEAACGSLLESYRATDETDLVGRMAEWYADLTRVYESELAYVGGCHRKRHTRRRRMLELCLRAPASCKRRLLSTSSSM